MVGTAHAAPDDRLTCEKCHGFYAVEVPEDGSEPRVRCNACGHIRELAIAPVQKKEEAGKWTVIGPDGKSMTFGSWEKLVESGSGRPPSMSQAAGSGSKQPAAASEEKKLSASALLDIAQVPTLPKLKLEDLESNPILPIAEANKIAAEGITKSVTKSKAPEWAPVKQPKETLKTGKAPSVSELDATALDDDEEPAPLSLRDAIPDEEEPSPLSLRDAIQDDDEPSPLSLRDAIPDDEDSSDPHETVSLEDVVLMTPEGAAVESSPHPPARGALRTLPPTPSKKGDAAPPPTITVDEDRKQAEAKNAAAKVDPKTVATKLDAKKSEKKSEKKGDAAKSAAAVPKKAETPKSESKGERRPAATARAAVAADEPKRGWLLPALAVGAVALITWRIMAASPAKTETPPTPPPAVATATPEATVQPSATETAPLPEPTVAATATVSAPADTTPATDTTPTPAVATATSAPVVATAATNGNAGKAPAAADTETPAPPEKKAATPAEGAVSMSDLLDRAGSARRSGDFATARELYERVIKQSPGNVEANGGLGDVARAQGDLTGAKTSYERALAASPSYGPAQLGLADTEWDLGNRPGAQRRYAQIVEQLGHRAPERAKQRGAPTE